MTPSHLTCRLRAERLRKGWDQKTLATLASIRQPVLCEIETGRVNPRPDERERLARALGLAPDTLMEPVRLVTEVTEP